MAVTGLITVNGKDVLEVDADPTTAGGIVASMGSLAMFDTGTVGQLYLKTGAAATAWSLMDSNASDWNLTGNTLTGGSSSAPNEFFGSNNDFDVITKRNGIEQYRLQLSAFLIGLNASVGGRLQVQAATVGAEVFKQITTAVSGANIAHVTRQFKVLTTDATLTALATITAPASCQMYVNMAIVGNRTGGTAGTAGDGAVYERTYRASRVAGIAVLNKVQTDFTSEDVAAFDTSTAVSTNDIVTSVKGQTNYNMGGIAHAKIFIATT